MNVTTRIAASVIPHKLRRGHSCSAVLNAVKYSTLNSKRMRNKKMARSTRRSKRLNKYLVEVWEGYGTLVIIDKLRNRRLTYEFRNASPWDPETQDSEITFGGNGYMNVRKVQDIFETQEELEAALKERGQ